MLDSINIQDLFYAFRSTILYSGWIYVIIALICFAAVGVGSYLIYAGMRETDSNDKSYLLWFGIIMVAVCLIFAFIFLLVGFPRVTAPDSYAWSEAIQLLRRLK